MGRESILPRVFGRTHSKHKSPFVATVFVALFCIVFTLLFATGLVGGGQRAALGIGVSNPLVALSQIGTWMPFQGNLLLFPIMALCSIAIMVYFLRNRDGFHWFKTLVAPILAAATIIFAVYLMISNRAYLLGTTTGVEFCTPFIALGVFRRRLSCSASSTAGGRGEDTTPSASSCTKKPDADHLRRSGASAVARRPRPARGTPGRIRGTPAFRVSTRCYILACR